MVSIKLINIFITYKGPIIRFVLLILILIMLKIEENKRKTIINLMNIPLLTFQKFHEIIKFVSVF